eukprot:1617336-Pleurochrysis_carterae.AAC.1
MARSPISIMVFNFYIQIWRSGLHCRGNRYHVQHGCRSDTSDLVVGDILHIPPSACTAEKAL